MVEFLEADFPVVFLPPEIQRDVDAMHAALVAGLRDSGAFERVTKWLATNAFEVMQAGWTDCVQAVSPLAVYDVASQLDDEEIREALELDDGEITQRHRMSYMLDVALPRLFDDADVSSAFAPFFVRTTTGNSFVLVYDIRGYSFSGLAVDWSGPYRAFSEFEEILKNEGWITDLKALSKLPLATRKRILWLERRDLR